MKAQQNHQRQANSLPRAARALDAEIREKFAQFLDGCRRIVAREDAKESTDEDLKIVAAHLARRGNDGEGA